MYKGKRILALIPARGGSKGIKKKNIALCAGRPLISYTIEAARKCSYIDKLHVSTDCSEIAEVCNQLGGKVDVLRPSHLAQDDSTAVQVLKFEIERLEGQGECFDLVLYLQPTSPLRTSKHLRESIEMFCQEAEKRPVDSLVSVVKVPHHYGPDSLMVINASGELSDYVEGEKTYLRQNKREYFARNGAAIYIFRIENIKKLILFGKKCLPYVMPKEESIDIDDSVDLFLAESLLQRRALANDSLTLDNSTRWKGVLLE